MIALSVTCRPLWQPWLLHQLAKQEESYKLYVFDDCSKPLTWTGPVVTARPSNRLQLSLGQKRQCLLDLIQDQREPFAWFDDDDWHPKHRFAVALEMFKSPVDVVGYHQGLFVDVKSLQTRKLQTGASVTFNGAVFAPQCSAHRFEPMHRGEDTTWLNSVLKDATVVSSPMMEHAWMSHDANVTGKRGSMSFEGPRFARLDSWEKAFLENL